MSSFAVDSTLNPDQLIPENPTTVGPVGENFDLVGEDRIGQLLLALRHVETSQRRLRDRLAKQLGLNRGELNAMLHLFTADELTPKELAAELAITSGSMTAMSDRLAASEFLVRTPNPADRRSLLLRLSPAGERAMHWVAAEVRQAIEQSAHKTDGLCGDTAARFLELAALEMDGLHPVLPSTPTAAGRPQK